jgi:hypothetical protein
VPDRADYLAKTLLTRLRSLEGVMREGGEQSESAQDRRRTELVEKVLAIEAGVVDGSVVRTVLSAMPTVHREPFSDKEKAEFAAFLRQRLRTEDDLPAAR